MPPRGCVLADVRDLFPEAEGAARRLPARVWLRVRDTAARLYGYYFVETEGCTHHSLCAI